MTELQQRNVALGREICDIIKESNCPTWVLSDIFNLTPEQLHKLKSGEIKPTVYQLIMFMCTTGRTLYKLRVSDYEDHK